MALLSRRAAEFAGGEPVLTEQQPLKPSRVEGAPLEKRGGLFASLFKKRG